MPFPGRCPGLVCCRAFSALVLAILAGMLVSARAGEWQLALRSGERLTGEVRRLDGVLRLYDPALRAERSVELATLSRLWQTDTAQPRQAGPVLSLRNGDLLAGTGITLDAAGLRLDLAGGGSLRLPREQLATLEPCRAGALASVTDLADLLDGKGGAAGWVRTATGAQARALPAILVRDGVLSERVRVVMELPAAPSPDLWLYLFTDSDTQPAGDGYALGLQGDSVIFERQYANGPARQVGSCRLAAPGSAVRQLILTADLARGRFRLDTPSGLGGDWTDAVTDAPSGRGLKLVCLKVPAEIHDLTVTRLPAAGLDSEATPSPTADRVYLGNGDRLEGEIIAIADAAWTVRRGTPPTALQLPAAAVRLACFRAAAAVPSEPTPSLEVRLHDGSRFRAAAMSIRDDRLRVRSAAWGEADFPLAALQELRFAPP